jgi:hypothetical protein
MTFMTFMTLAVHTTLHGDSKYVLNAFQRQSEEEMLAYERLSLFRAKLKFHHPNGQIFFFS